MKKGFTLIELLAVIVILAVLAIIATPIVLNIIDDSKKNATLRSSENYIKAVEFSIAKSVMENRRLSDGNYPIMSNGSICIGTLSGNSCTDELVVEVSGETPESGNVTIKSRKIDSYKFTYKSGFVVVNGEINSDGVVTLAQFIIKQAKDNNYYYETTPDFSKIPTASETGLYQAPDDLGTSYYFRGDTENNYVEFGEYYWRIVRINGDNTIRLILNNDLGQALYSSEYGSSWYAKYNNSSIKNFLNDWYNETLKTNYAIYIADNIFCNDLEVAKQIYVDANGEEIENVNNSDDFYIREYFGSYKRIVEDKKPKLTCTRKEDKYTMNEAIGNGNLINPIGLITADEVAMAGTVYGKDNTNYYLYTENEYWTGSPFLDNGIDDASMFAAYEGRLLEQDFYGSLYSGDEIVARPVINLKADVKFTGDGSYGSPYVIVTE